MSPRNLTPLRFEPLLRRYVWGGRRLETMLGKRLGDGHDYAESWEIVDRHEHQSIVAAGSLTGMSLAQLLTEYRAELLGRHQAHSRFPLMFKFLDANQKLSVQVHPNDEQAARLPKPDLGKTEAWLILHAEPNSVIYAGLKRGFDRAAFERELDRGVCDLCLNRLEPRAGDCVFLPAGVVHSLGAGLVVAEIQQSSDVTYRLFDWNRVGPDGCPRELHIERGLAVTNFDHPTIGFQIPQPTEWPCVERLVACDQFVMDRWRWQGPRRVCGDERFHILVTLEGNVRVEGDPLDEPLRPGQTMLLPASMNAIEITAVEPSVLLDMYLP